MEEVGKHCFTTIYDVTPDTCLTGNGDYTSSEATKTTRRSGTAQSVSIVSLATEQGLQTPRCLQEQREMPERHVD